jgi:hypothetical protein
LPGTGKRGYGVERLVEGMKTSIVFVGKWTKKWIQEQNMINYTIDRK